MVVYKKQKNITTQSGLLTGSFQISACRHTHNQTKRFDLGQGEGFYKPAFIRCNIDEILLLVGQPFLCFLGVLAGRVTGRGSGGGVVGRVLPGRIFALSRFLRRSPSRTQYPGSSVVETLF